MQVVSEGLLVFSMNEIKHVLMHHIRLGDRGTNEEGQYERNNVKKGCNIILWVLKISGPITNISTTIQIFFYVFERSMLCF